KAAEQAEVEREIDFRRDSLARLELRHADPTAHIYENPSVFGPVWMATELVHAAAPGAIDDCVLSRAGHRVACVAPDDVEGVEWPSSSSGEARVVAESDGAVDVEAESATGGVLVVARLAYPGWAATRDGKPAKIVRVNGALAAVVLPPGSHRISFRYRPT